MGMGKEAVSCILHTLHSLVCIQWCDLLWNT